jgi:hypothetical protein
MVVPENRKPCIAGDRNGGADAREVARTGAQPPMCFMSSIAAQMDQPHWTDGADGEKTYRLIEARGCWDGDERCSSNWRARCAGGRVAAEPAVVLYWWRRVSWGAGSLGGVRNGCAGG